MRHVIVFLRASAALLIACQLGVLIATPLVLCCITEAAAGTPEECDWHGEVGEECPMHQAAHPSTGTNLDKTTSTTHCQAGCGDEATEILSLSAPSIGVLAEPLGLSVAMLISGTPRVLAELLSSHTTPPLSPPPRT